MNIDCLLLIFEYGACLGEIMSLNSVNKLWNNELKQFNLFYLMNNMTDGNCECIDLDKCITIKKLYNYTNLRRLYAYILNYTNSWNHYQLKILSQLDIPEMKSSSFPSLLESVVISKDNVLVMNYLLDAYTKINRRIDSVMFYNCQSVEMFNIMINSDKIITVHIINLLRRDCWLGYNSRIEYLNKFIQCIPHKVLLRIPIHYYIDCGLNDNIKPYLNGILGEHFAEFCNIPYWEVKDDKSVANQEYLSQGYLYRLYIKEHIDIYKTEELSKLCKLFQKWLIEYFPSIIHPDMFTIKCYFEKLSS